jgi:hypothetical protein
MMRHALRDRISTSSFGLLARTVGGVTGGHRAGGKVRGADHDVVAATARPDDVARRPRRNGCADADVRGATRDAAT